MFGALETLATQQDTQTDLTPAKKTWEEIVALRTEMYGEKDPRVNDARWSLYRTQLWPTLRSNQRQDLAKADQWMARARYFLNQMAELRKPFKGTAEQVYQAAAGAAEAAGSAVTLRRKVYGDGNPQTADALEALAAAQSAMWDGQRAEANYKAALEIRKKLQGENHPGYAACRQAYVMAIAYALAVPFERETKLTPEQLKRLAERDRLHAAAMEIWRKGDLRSAYRQLEAVLRIEREVYGEVHEEIGGSYRQLAQVAFQQGQTQSAMQQWARAADTFTKALGPESWQAGEARYYYNNLLMISKLSREQLGRLVAAQEAPIKLKQQEAFSKLAYDKKLVQVMALGEEMRRLLLNTLGEDNLYYANCLDGQAGVYDSQKNPEEAEALYRKAVEITGRVMGKNHPIYLERLIKLANRYGERAESAQEEGELDLAERLLKRRLEILELRYPAGDWRLRDGELKIAHNAKLAKLSKSDRELALKLAGEIRQRGVFGSRAPVLPSDGKDRPSAAELERQWRETYALLCRLLGTDDLQTVDCLGALVGVCDSGDDVEGAIALKGKYLDNCREVLGRNHPQTARLDADLGVIYYNRGDYARAEPLLSEAREVLEAIGKTDTDEYGTSLNNLAVLYEALGDFDRAEPLLRKIVTIEIPTIEERPLDTEEFYQAGKKYEVLMAEFNATEALRVEYASEPPPPTLDFSELAQCVNNLGLIAESRNNLTVAEAQLRQSLGLIQTKDREASSPEYATGLANLAAIYQKQGDLDRADLLLERVVAIRRDAYSKEDLAQALTRQGAIAFRRGDLDRAGQLWTEALTARREYSGDRHPNTALSIANLAVLDDRQGNLPRAAERLEIALDIAAENLQLVSSVQSERQQLITSKTLRGYLDQLLSLTTRSKLPPQDVYRHVLGWKGMVSARMRRMRQMREAAQAEGGEELSKLYHKLDVVNQELARVALKPSMSKWAREKLNELSLDKDNLEKTLSQQSSQFVAWKKTWQVSVDEVKSYLPPGTALVDIVEYTHTAYPEQKDAEPVHTQRLTAFVLRPGKPTEQVDLGPAEPVESLVDACRGQWTSGRTSGNEDPAAELRRRIWDPLSPHLETAQTVLISPDGALGRFPLAALPGEKPDSYLIEDVAIAVVPVPQLLGELVSPSAASKADAGELLLVGAVDFDAQPGAGSEDFAAAAPREGKRDSFAPLPGTAEEVKAIKKLYDATHKAAPSVALEGGAATESAVRNAAPAARYLHLATHGFFAPPDVKRADVDDGEVLETETSLKPSVEGWNPGLLSGIVLAGVNQPVDGVSDDGILTAAEVAALDLSAAQLVVLSACETGLGQIAGGEGALGLQRRATDGRSAQRGLQPVESGRRGYGAADERILQELVAEAPRTAGGVSRGTTKPAQRQGRYQLAAGARSDRRGAAAGQDHRPVVATAVGCVRHQRQS